MPCAARLGAARAAEPGGARRARSRPLPAPLQRVGPREREPLGADPPPSPVERDRVDPLLVAGDRAVLRHGDLGRTGRRRSRRARPMAAGRGDRRAEQDREAQGPAARGSAAPPVPSWQRPRPAPPDHEDTTHCRSSVREPCEDLPDYPRASAWTAGAGAARGRMADEWRTSPRRVADVPQSGARRTLVRLSIRAIRTTRRRTGEAVMRGAWGARGRGWRRGRRSGLGSPTW